MVRASSADESSNLRWAEGRHDRIVKHGRPTSDDFSTIVAVLGREPRGRATIPRRRQFHGISVLDSLEHARARAVRFPHLGGYIAELAIPPEAPIIYEGPDSFGHGNLYNAPPEVLAGLVVRVTPVARSAPAGG